VKSPLSVTVRDVSYNFYQKKQEKALKVKHFWKYLTNEKKKKYWERKQAENVVIINTLIKWRNLSKYQKKILQTNFSVLYSTSHHYHLKRTKKKYVKLRMSSTCIAVKKSLYFAWKSSENEWKE